MTKSRLEADSIYHMLEHSHSENLPYSKEVYENKLMKLVDILKDDIKDSYYIQKHQVEFWDILEFPNINYIYNKLKYSDFYLGAKEV